MHGRDPRVNDACEIVARTLITKPSFVCPTAPYRDGPPAFAHARSARSWSSAEWITGA